MSNPAQYREILQEAILRTLDANHTQFGLNAGAISVFVRMDGFPHATPEVIGTELDYLSEKGFVQVAGKPLEPANRHWRRTAAARDYLSERGQA